VNIHLVTVVGSHIDLLPHMLHHYRELGVDSLIVNVHLEKYGDPLYEAVLEVTRAYDAEIGCVFAGKWLQSVNPFLYAQSRDKRPKDWFIMADLDEFQVYPRPLRQFLGEMENAGYDYVEGCVIDRISRDGSFPEIKQEVPLWEQFPLAGMITYPLLGANIQKVVAAKGLVKLGLGQHFARNGIGCPREREYIPVHHFKWFKDLVVRLQKRVEFYKAVNESIWVESQRFVDYCETHSGRIDVLDPQLLLAESAKDYVLWDQVKRMVLAHPAAAGRKSA
jgi:hypothetical protein